MRIVYLIVSLCKYVCTYASMNVYMDIQMIDHMERLILKSDPATAGFGGGTSSAVSGSKPGPSHRESGDPSFFETSMMPRSVTNCANIGIYYLLDSIGGKH